MPLRDYQLRAIARMREEIKAGHKAVLLVLPTGGGKTAIATEIIRRAIAQGKRVLFLAHRTELIKQAARRLCAEGVEKMRIIQAGSVAGPEDAPVTVASIQTLSGDKWRGRLPQADLVIFDEAHHTKAATWEAIAEAYSGAYKIGLTATPERHDGAALGDIYTSLVKVASVAELTQMGFLVPCSVFGPSEFKSQLAQDPADAYVDHAEGRKAIIFCPTVESARDVATRLTERGVPSACVDGKIPDAERSAHIKRFADGELRVLTNCQVLTEGFDDPSTEVCVLARGCDHVGLYMQIVGRVLRTAPGKHSAKLIDLRGAVHRHGMPDDDREFSLDGKPISTPDRLAPLKQCRKCGAVFRPVPRCPECGADSPMPELPEVRRARIEQILAQHSPDRRREYWNELCHTAKERGYKIQWAYHRYRARYGEASPFPQASIGVRVQP